jgi:hypothetical protein
MAAGSTGAVAAGFDMRSALRENRVIANFTEEYTRHESVSTCLLLSAYSILAGGMNGPCLAADRHGPVAIVTVNACESIQREA